MIITILLSTAAAFKFSPSLNGESSVMTKVEREKRLEEIRKVRLHHSFVFSPINLF